MARSFLLFFLFIQTVFSLDIRVSVGETNSGNYSILELSQAEKFICRYLEKTNTQKEYIICDFQKIPLVKPTQTNNNFFEIIPIIADNHFYIRINGKKNIAIKVPEGNTLDDFAIYKRDTKETNYWVILGFENEMPFLNPQDDVGLNYPVKLSNIVYPYIGALDLDGNPIKSAPELNDFNEFKGVMELYDKARYDVVLRKIDTELLLNKSTTLFLPEVLVIKMRTLQKLKNKEEEIITVAKPWVEAYTTHKDLPEVMLLLAESYLNIGLIKDADYYLNTVIDEFPGNSFAEQALIVQGDRVTKEGKPFLGKGYYERAFYETDDKDVASFAAEKIARYYISTGESTFAGEFYNKILDSNPAYFLKDFKKSYSLLAELDSRKLYTSAKKLGQILFDTVTTTDKEYQPLILNNARWNKETKDYEKAKEYYELYLTKFSFVKDADEVRKEYDYLLFEMNQGDDKYKIALFDKLIDKYPNDKIAQFGIYNKMEIFQKNQELEEIKKLLPEFENLDRDLFKNVDEEIKRIARKLTLDYLDANKCFNALSIMAIYKPLLSPNADHKIYDCAKSQGDNKLAIEITDKYLNTLSPMDSQEWMLKKANILLLTGDLNGYLEQISQFLKLKKAIGERVDYKVLYDYALVNYKTKNFQNLLETVVNIDSLYFDELKNLDLYFAIVNLSQELNISEYFKKYSLKIINTQNKINLDTFSPTIELKLSDYEKKLKNYDFAIDLLNVLLDKDRLNIEKKSQVLYNLGDIYDLNNQKDKANEIFKKCSVDENLTDWTKLCKDRVK